MRLAVKSHALPVYKKNRIASLLCIFESIIGKDDLQIMLELNTELICSTIIIKMSRDMRFQQCGMCDQQSLRSASDTHRPIRVFACRMNIL